MSPLRPGMPRVPRALLAAVLVGPLAGGCTSTTSPVPIPSATTGASARPGTASASGSASAPTTSSGAGGAALLAPDGRPVYAHTSPQDVQGQMASAKPMVYVPNQIAGTLQVIDPTTYQVVSRTRVPASPEHVVPDHDGSVLLVNSDQGNALTPIDPMTGAAGKPIPVDDPYNLSFTPDGVHALVMAERLRRIDVRDPQTFALQRSIPVPCVGVNHGDYTADLTTMPAASSRPSTSTPCRPRVPRHPRWPGGWAAPTRGSSTARRPCRRTCGSPPTAGSSSSRTCYATGCGSSTRRP